MIYSHGLINSCFLQHLAEKSKSSYYRFLICSSKNCFLTENITWHQKAIIIHQFAIHAKELQTLQDSKQWLWVCVRTCHACVMLMSYMEFRKSHCNEEEKKISDYLLKYWIFSFVSRAGKFLYLLACSRLLFQKLITWKCQDF